MNSSASGNDAHAGGIVFATTHWSIVLTAQGRSPEADAALETLCRTYWLPLYAFIRREGYEMEEAKDLTQEFFARWLERRDFDAARREKGRLRSYLLVSLKHFLTNERNKARTAKRGHGRQPISLDEIIEQQRFALEPVETLTADQIYERQWATTVLDRMSQLKPPPWKGPLLAVTLDATILVVAVCVVALFVVGIRRALPSKPRA